MNAITYDRRDESWEGDDEQRDAGRVPRRPRRQFFNKRSAALAALLTCAAGFYAGVRVEKGQVSSSGSGGSSLAAALAAARSGSDATRSGAGAGSANAASPGAAAGTAGGLGALSHRGGFGGSAGGNASFGTISNVDGNTLYVTTATGNVVKVKLSSAAKLSKSLAVKRSSLHPGDAVVIRGLTNSKGTITASSVTDSGSGGGAGGLFGAGGSGSGSRGAGSGTSASSALGSLFSPGGSGGSGGSGNTAGAGGSGG